MKSVYEPTLRHFRYLEALAEEGHFGRAAARVGIAQPPFSQQISKLEKDLGVPLVERRPVVRLTPAGEAFVSTGRRLAAQLADGLADTLRIGTGEKGRLRLGFAASTLMTRLPRALRRFRDRYPDVEFELRELSTAGQVQALAAGELDLGVTREVRDPHPLVECVPLIRERLVAVLPPGHRLERRKRIHLAELTSDPFVFFSAAVAPGLHETLSDLFVESQFKPRLVMEALEWITIVGLVEAGVGVSIVPESFTRLRLGDVVYVRLQANARTTAVSLCSRRNPGPAALNMMGLIRAEMTGAGSKP